MKLWLDTADIEQIREINAWGVLKGVTTNPSLAAKTSVSFEQLIKEICTEVDGPVSAEVVSMERAQMVADGERLAGIASNVVVKLPMTAEGVAATTVLAARDIPVNMTLCFTATQAILAAEAGATYISPFLGRLDDIGIDGIGMLAEIVEVYRVQGYATKVLAASLRSPQHVVDSARVGADVATMPYEVFKALVNHPLTDAGLTRFLADWDAYQEKLGS